MNSRTRTAVLISVIVLLVVGAVFGTLLHKPNEQTAMTQPGKLSQLTMIDTRTGWALTGDDQIFRTIDGGATWTDVSIFQAPTSRQTVPVTAACFLDGKTAFVATNAGTDNQPQIVAYYTNDEGATWNRTSIAPQLDWEKSDVGGLMISFADASNGYLMITGTPGAGQMAKSLYRSVDGGTTFSFVGDITGMTDEAGTVEGIAGYPTGMTFSTPETGFVTCFYSAYTYVLMFKTMDAGTTWRLWSVPVPAAYQNLKPAQDFYADAYPPVFFGEQKKDGMFMLDYVQNGNHVMQSYRTTDAGDTWTLGPVSNNPDVATYSFIDAATGWGADRSGKLFATIDGGATWTAVTTTAK